LQSKRRWIQYIFALLVSLLAAAAEASLGRTRTSNPFLLAFAALIAAACGAGAGPGLLSLLLVTAATTAVLHSQGYTAADIVVRCLVFVSEGLLLCAFSARSKLALSRAATGEQWHRGLMETAAEGIWVTDERGAITYANPRIAEILGCSASELTGRGTEEFFFPEDVPAERIRIRNRRDGVREQFDRRLRRKDGSEAWVLVAGNSFRSKTGEFQGMLSMMTDITERKNAERALRRSEERFRGLFENVLEGVYQSTPDGRILAANPMLLNMLGLASEADFNDVDIAEDLYPDPSVRRQLLDSLEQDGSFRNVEYALRRRDGQIIRVLENARVVRGDDGAVLYYEGTLSDITEKREIEEQLRLGQEAEVTGRMAGAIAQDFSNALTAVSGYARLVLDDLSPGHPAHASASDLLRAVDNASEMTRQLAVFSRQRTAWSATIDLNRLICRIEDTLRSIAGPDVLLTIVPTPSPVMVQADPAHIEQIAVNLASGARQAITGRGAMEVTIGSSGYFAALSMRCVGCGESAAHFGLSTIQAIVAQYGGTVTEDRGEGTALVSILIPEAR
jgi:PAS domain S-box-containing protein